ncbi:hypothetical protein M3Y97_00955100 [Aphelenchoides bicaudatus]|nr:hypothetical protein M3Y97_00955100 [Aphelenchoides bicaudatus]
MAAAKEDSDNKNAYFIFANYTVCMGIFRTLLLIVVRQIVPPEVINLLPEADPNPSHHYRYKIHVSWQFRLWCVFEVFEMDSAPSCLVHSYWTLCSSNDCRSMCQKVIQFNLETWSCCLRRPHSSRSLSFDCALGHWNKVQLRHLLHTQAEICIWYHFVQCVSRF